VQADLIVSLRKVLLASDWAALSTLLSATTDATLQQLDEVRGATQELDDARAATEAEVTEALASGRSLKVIGAKKMKNARYGDKEYWVPVEWDHSGLEMGIRRLSRAVEAAHKFPTPLEGAKELFATAEIALKLRKLVHERAWKQLGAALEGMTSLAEQRLDEVTTAWQEYLCWELERATTALDQPALKLALAKATSVGMLPVEKPVDRALAVFIDPPEYILNLREGDVYPGNDGKLVLRVKVRGAHTIHWVKNGINLREGADGGRIKGVDSQELTITHLLGRDKDQKVWMIATNKFGTVESNKVQLRTEAKPAALQRQQVKNVSQADLAAAMAAASHGGSMVQIGSSKMPSDPADEPADASHMVGAVSSHKLKFGATLGEVTKRPSMSDEANTSSRVSAARNYTGSI